MPITCPVNKLHCQKSNCHFTGTCEVNGYIVHQATANNQVDMFLTPLAKKPERDYTRFYTMPETADLMVTLAKIEPGMKVLEPHAGAGAILGAIRAAFGRSIHLHACEINRLETAKLLQYNPDVLMMGDFLQVPIKSWAYDRIIANPPFGNETDLGAHVVKMYNILKNGGIMVCILPEDFEFKDVPRPRWFVVEPLRNWGTNKDGSVTPIKLLTLIK